MLTCPYCKYKGDECDFPDFFYIDCESKKPIVRQYKMLLEIQKKGYNIVNCGMCGDVFIQKL